MVVERPDHHSCDDLVTFVYFVGSFSFSWQFELNTRATGSRPNGATTIDLCKEACLGTDGCDSVDWDDNADEGSQCYLSGSWSIELEIGTATGFTHYSFTRTRGRRIPDQSTR